MISIFLVGGVDLVRGALATVIAHEEDLDVSELSLRDDVVAVARVQRPAAVIVDIDDSDMGGLPLVERFGRELPACPVLVLTERRAPDVLRRALAAGVRGLLSAGASPEQVVRSIRLVAAGEHAIDPALAAVALLPPDNPLTARERAVLRLAAEGLRSQEIAARLFLSTGTVRNYLSSAIRKTGAGNRLAAIRRAREAGWL